MLPMVIVQIQQIHKIEWEESQILHVPPHGSESNETTSPASIPLYNILHRILS